MDKKDWPTALFLPLLILIVLVLAGCLPLPSVCYTQASEVRKLSPEERGEHPPWEFAQHWWVVIFPVDPPPTDYTIQFQFEIGGGLSQWEDLDLKPVGLEEPGKTRFGMPTLIVPIPGSKDSTRWRMLSSPPCE